MVAWLSSSRAMNTGHRVTPSPCMTVRLMILWNEPGKDPTFMPPIARIQRWQSGRHPMGLFFYPSRAGRQHAADQEVER